MTGTNTETESPCADADQGTKSVGSEPGEGTSLNADDEPPPCDEDQYEPPDHSFPDGGYGWVIVGACFLGRIMFALALNYGLFYVEMLEQFGRSKEMTSMIGSFLYACTCASGPLADILCGVIGHRGTCMLGSLLISGGYIISSFSPNLELLFFSYSILSGMGINFMMVSCTVMVGLYFKKRRDFVMGITVAGGGLGGLVFPIITQYFIDTFSWRGAMVLLSGVALQGCVAGALLRPNKKCILKKEHIFASALRSKLQVLKNGYLYLTFTSLLLEGMHSIIFLNLIPDRVIGYGFPAEQAALLLSVIGISSIISRFVTGSVLHFVKINRILPYGSTVALMAVSEVILILDKPRYGLLVFGALFFGFFYGACVTMLPLYEIELFGLRNLGLVYGFGLIGEGIGGFLGPPLATTLYERTGSYKPSFILAAMAAIASGSMTVLLYCHRKKKLEKYII